MGPDLFGREIALAKMRSLAAALRFNGARPVRSGDRLPEVLVLVGSGHAASMGPDLFGREIARAQPHEAVHGEPASMGPDLFGREIARGVT